MVDPSITFTADRQHAVVAEPDASQFVYACAISPDGLWIVATCAYKSIEAHVIDVATGNTQYTTMHRGTHVYCIAWHSDARRYVVSCGDGSLTEVKLAQDGTWSHKLAHKHGGSMYSCAVSSTGLVAVDPPNNGVAILNSNSNYALVQTLLVSKQGKPALAFSSDGSLLADGCADGSLHVYGYNESSGLYELVVIRQAHASSIKSISFSSSGSHLIIGSDDTTASIWSVPSSPMTASAWPRDPLHILPGHRFSITGTCFTGDGDHAMTTSIDRKVRIWRVSDGSHVTSFDVPSPIWCMAFHAASGLLVGGLNKQTLQLWRCPPYVSVEPSSYTDARVRLSNATKSLAAIEADVQKLDLST